MIVLRSSLFALALILLTPPYALIVLATFPLPRHARYRVITGWAHIVHVLARFVLGIRVQVEGRANLPVGPAVLLAKHQSAWETIAFQVLFPPQVYLLKRELLWIPFFGWGLALMSPIAIDRSRGRAALKALAQGGAERIAQGFWVVVFPEGTRVAPGARRAYQPGGAWLAARSKVPIVPVAHNAGVVWPRNAFLKYPGTITVRIGPAIDTAGRDPKTITALAEEWIETQQKELCPDS